MSRTGFIIVDDIDPSIHYTGSWYPDQGSRDSVGIYGPPHQSTLHGVNSNASLSFAFNGSLVMVIGSNNILNSSGVLDPTWDCFIDGISIGPTYYFASVRNNHLFCDHFDLVDGPHVLTVNATVLKNTTFWFDNIQYLPSASVPLNQAAIIVDSHDSRLQYGTGWGARGGFANMTTVAGSIFTFDFIGVSLSWYGHIPVDLNLSPFSPSSATYSIDGETPISFLLKGLPVNSTTTLYNQKFFETTKLSPTSHTLKVVYEGNNSTPLILDYLIIQNGTSSSSTTTSLPTSTVSATSTPKKSLAVGSIVGGVIGGLALLVFAVLGFFLLRRRQKRRHQNRDAQEIVLSTPRPFEYTPSNPSAVGFSYSPFPQTAQSRSHVMKGQATSHVSMPSVTNTEPPSTSSGVTAYPTNLHPVPFQQTALHLANPLSSFSSSPLTPSSGQPVPLRPQGRRNPSVPVSAQSNDTRSSNANVVLHADSGIRMPSNTTSTSVVDLPPLYTPD